MNNLYWAAVGDDCSFCIHRGVYPKSEGLQWCSGVSSCAGAGGEGTATFTADADAAGYQAPASTTIFTSALASVSASVSASALSAFPCTCSFESWQALGHDVNSHIADPLFVDAAAHNFALRADSPARVMGIKSLDDAAAVGPRPVAWQLDPRA